MSIDGDDGGVPTSSGQGFQMQLFRRAWLIAGASSVVLACGEKTPEPTPTPADASATIPTEPAESGKKDPAPAQPKPTEPPPVEPKPAEPAPSEAKPDEPAAPTGGPWLVWSDAKDGYATSWVNAEGDVVATRPEAVAVIDGTLWAVQWRYVPYNEVDCAVLEAKSPDVAASQAKAGATKYVEYIVAKGLAGKMAGVEKELVKAAIPSVSGERPAQGAWRIVGEHYGRTISLVGNGGRGVWFSECDSGYACGAHGAVECRFHAADPATGASVLNLADLKDAVAELRKGTAKDVVEGADIDEQPNDADLGLAEVVLGVSRGMLSATYRFQYDVPYASSDGSWSSYTRTVVREGPPVEGLGVAAVPGVLAARQAVFGRAKVYGFSEVPSDMAATFLTAFQDTATLAGAKPDNQPPNSARTERLVATGRRETNDRRYDRAIQAFDIAITMDANYARAWSGRGFAYLRSKDLDKAGSDFEKALTLDKSPKFQAAVWFNLSEVAERKGDKAGAIAAARKSFDLNGTEAAKKRLDSLQKQ